MTPRADKTIRNVVVCLALLGGIFAMVNHDPRLLDLIGAAVALVMTGLDRQKR